MERIFTKDHGPRHPMGRIVDYPLATWNQFFPGYRKFTNSVAEAAQDSLKRRKKDGKSTD